MAEKIELNGMSNFDTNGEPAQLSQSWKRWLRSFELFATGKGVTNTDQNKALLLHCAGVYVQDIYFTLAEEDDEDSDAYDNAKQTLNEHFSTKVNLPYERYCFRTMKQMDGETVDQFVTRLRQKAVLCDFENVNEQIRDQVIEKCSSHHLRTKLLEKGHNLDLDTLRTIAATSEIAQRQAREIESSLPRAINRLSTSNTNYGGAKPKSYTPSRPIGNYKCYRCGREGHYGRDPKCPAKDKKCNNCDNIGHFANCCNTKTDKQRKSTFTNKKVYTKPKKHFVRQVDSDDEYAFGVGQTEKTEIYIGGNPVDVIIDSGATVNIIDSSLWDNLKRKKIKCQSQKTEKKLYAYGSDEPLELSGMFTTKVTLKNKENEKEAEFYVLKGNGPALLGRTTATELGLLAVGPVNYVTDIYEQYDDLFSGIGKLNDYQLKLHVDESVTPVAQRMYRIPYTLRQKVSNKLDELESLDIIEKVTTPTEWVSPMIVVPKSDGDIRICIDMRQANQAIIRERQPIPTVDEILYKMNGSEVYSKIDLKYGFHQLELEESSRNITTFVTHKGLYRYKRLMFGINAAPEKYQYIIGLAYMTVKECRIFRTILSCLEGIKKIMTRN